MQCWVLLEASAFTPNLIGHFQVAYCQRPRSEAGKDFGIGGTICSRLLYLDVRPSIEVVDHTLHDCLSRPTPILCCLLGQPML